MAVIRPARLLIFLGALLLGIHGSKETGSYGDGAAGLSKARIKLTYRKITRKVPMPGSFSALLKLISKTYSGSVRVPDIHISYVDADGDQITIQRDDELLEAFESAREAKRTLKLLISASHDEGHTASNTEETGGEGVSLTSGIGSTGNTGNTDSTIYQESASKSIITPYPSMSPTMVGQHTPAKDAEFRRIDNNPSFFKVEGSGVPGIDGFYRKYTPSEEFGGKWPVFAKEDEKSGEWRYWLRHFGQNWVLDQHTSFRNVSKCKAYVKSTASHPVLINETWHIYKDRRWESAPSMYIVRVGYAFSYGSASRESMRPTPPISEDNAKTSVSSTSNSPETSQGGTKTPSNKSEPFVPEAKSEKNHSQGDSRKTARYSPVSEGSPDPEETSSGVVADPQEEREEERREGGSVQEGEKAESELEDVAAETHSPPNSPNTPRKSPINSPEAPNSAGSSRDRGRASASDDIGIETPRKKERVHVNKNSDSNKIEKSNDIKSKLSKNDGDKSDQSASNTSVGEHGQSSTQGVATSEVQADSGTTSDEWKYPGIRPLLGEFAEVESQALYRLVEEISTILKIMPFLLLLLTGLALGHEFAPSSTGKVFKLAYYLILCAYKRGIVAWRCLLTSITASTGLSKKQKTGGSASGTQNTIEQEDLPVPGLADRPADVRSMSSAAVSRSRALKKEQQKRARAAAARREGGGLGRTKRYI